MYHHLIELIPAALLAIVPLLFCMVLTPPTPQIIGKSTTIVWGTAPGGTAIIPVVASMVVVSAKITPINGGAVGIIENGDGARVERIYLDDGFDMEVEGVYDTALTYPVQASTVTLTLPKAVDLSGNAVHTVFPCTVESNPIDFQRKKETMISFKITHSPGVDGVADS